MWSKNLVVLLAGLTVVAAARRPEIEIRVCPDGQLLPDGINADDVLSGTTDGSVVVVDVREPEEAVDTGVIPGSHIIPMDEAEHAFSLSPEEFESTYGFPKPSPAALVLSCVTGVRATRVWERIRKFDYCPSRVYFGSIEEWNELGYPTEEWLLDPTPTQL